MPTPTFKAKLSGGPQHGLLFETEILEASDLPEIVNETADGFYKLVDWSKLPSDFDTTHLFRGAQYDWQERS